MQHAIALLGFRTVTSIVLAASLREVFTHFGLAEKQIWEHSTICGAVAARLASYGPVDVDRDDFSLVLAFWSGVKRSGRWTPPRHLNAIAVMGGAELDLREAVFPEGVTTVNAIAVMGGVEIVVPPGLQVKSSGIPLMGGFESLDQDGDPDQAPGAVLKIRGIACMGGVEVRVARRGEAVPDR